MTQRYLVKVRQETVWDVTIDAEDSTDAYNTVLIGLGECGNPQHQELEIVSVRCLDGDTNEQF